MDLLIVPSRVAVTVGPGVVGNAVVPSQRGKNSAVPGFEQF